MGVVEKIDSVLAMVKTSLKIADSGGDPTDVILELIDTNQNMRFELVAAKNLALSLEEELLEFKKNARKTDEFASIRERYRLQTLSTGTVVYTLKKETNSEGGSHYLCANCFQQEVKSYLNFQAENFHTDTYKCPHCQEKFKIPNNKTADSYTYDSIPPDDGFI